MNAYEKNGVFQCDCGFSWLRGESGNHNCADGLREKVKQLAAENVALRAEQVRIFNSGYLRGHESTVEGYYVDIHQDDITTYHEDVVAEISEEQTPATDRIVAGIKADGVEMFVEKCREESMRAISSDIRNNWWLAGEHAEDFASQLREVAK